jgi:hypothetical protein
MPLSAKEATQATELDIGLTRMTTRTKNAKAHPGNVVLENSRVRRSKAEVQQEKQSKKEKKAAKEREMAEADALKAAGKAFVAQREEEEDAALANAEKDFPRRRAGAQSMYSPLLWRQSFTVSCILVDKCVPGEKVVNAHTGKRKPEHGPKTRSVQPAMAQESTLKVIKHGVCVRCPSSCGHMLMSFTRIEATAAPITAMMSTMTTLIRRRQVRRLKS